MSNEPEWIEQTEPTRLSEWKYPGRVLYIGEAAMEAASGGQPNDVMAARTKHEQAEQDGTLSELMESLDNMDLWLREHLPSSDNVVERRAARKTHLNRYCNWLYADGHTDRVQWMNGTRTDRDWLVLLGVTNSVKTGRVE